MEDEEHPSTVATPSRPAQVLSCPLCVKRFTGNRRGTACVAHLATHQTARAAVPPTLLAAANLHRCPHCTTIFPNTGFYTRHHVCPVPTANPPTHVDPPPLTFLQPPTTEDLEWMATKPPTLQYLHRSRHTDWCENVRAVLKGYIACPDRRHAIQLQMLSLPRIHLRHREDEENKAKKENPLPTNDPEWEDQHADSSSDDEDERNERATRNQTKLAAAAEDRQFARAALQLTLGAQGKAARTLEAEPAKRADPRAALLGYTARTETRADPGRKRFDAELVSGSAHYATDVTVRYPVGGRGHRADDAMKEKQRQYQQQTTGTGITFTPLVLESTGGIHLDSLKWIRRIADDRPHPYTTASALGYLLSQLAEHLVRQNYLQVKAVYKDVEGLLDNYGLSPGWTNLNMYTMMRQAKEVSDSTYSHTCTVRPCHLTVSYPWDDFRDNAPGHSTERCCSNQLLSRKYYTKTNQLNIKYKNNVEFGNRTLNPLDAKTQPDLVHQPKLNPEGIPCQNISHDLLPSAKIHTAHMEIISGKF
eukprot:gene4799-3441_t